MGSAKPGKLSIVSTPIGNLEDITVRALRTLKEADLILAEDTRRTRKLCAHHGISTRLRSFHAHSPGSVGERLVKQLDEGAHLALVADAGTPLISDPGVELVRAASENGIVVQAIPGPSAVIAALSVSAVRFDSFRFLGFLPRSGKRRKKTLEAIAIERGATVLFESPLRIARTLGELAEVIGPDRTVALCRELTKVHEEVARGSAAELQKRFGQSTRGEITLVIEGAGPSGEKPDPARLEAAIREYLEQGMSARDIARTLAEQTSLPRKAIYAKVIQLRDENA